MPDEIFLDLVHRIHPFPLIAALNYMCRFVQGGMEDCEPDDLERLVPLWDATEQFMNATVELEDDETHSVEVWYAAFQHYTDEFAQLFTPYCDFSKPGHGQICEYDKVVILLALMICRGLSKPLVDVSLRWSEEGAWKAESEEY